MMDGDDFQMVITGKFIPCWVCGATRDDGTYAAYTTCGLLNGRILITPHRPGCLWSDEAGNGVVTDGLARSLYGSMEP